MEIKEYECEECGRFSVIHSNPNNINKLCTWCGNKVKVINSHLVQEEAVLSRRKK